MRSPQKHRLALLHKELTDQIIGAAIEVHRELGPGLLESAYQRCLCHELELRDLAFQTEVMLPLHYKGLTLDGGYRIDLIVEDRVLVELKAVAELVPVHQAQLLTYLRLSGLRVGLLMNFCAPTLIQGLLRRVL